MSKIVFTGANGMLGTEMRKLYEEDGEVAFYNHNQLELLDPASIGAMLEFEEPEVVVHLAALTDVLLGEKQRDYYYKVNVLGTRNLVSLLDPDTTLMYWSTEYVFDGEKGDYTEYDTPNPINYYGLSKLLGEAEARRANKHIIIRTAMKPRPYKHDKVPAGSYSTGGYVDDMAKEYKLAIDHYEDLPEVINIGLKKKLLTDLARETKQVEEIDLKSIPVRLPKDASLELNNWNRLKKRWQQESALLVK